jgi:alpha-L-fucosidase
MTGRTIDFPADRTRWFAEARFGMFIHWGLYALIGRGEWVMSRERIGLGEYEQLLGRFDPTDYNPGEWAKIARRNGMRYMVLTTKHHEGFCLWDSKACDFNAVRSGAKRDLLAEYVQAVRAEGLKVGFYYSLGDWRHPDWARAVCEQDDAAARRFADWTHAMVDELMTGYGRVDVLWYDLPQGMTAEQWRSVELNARVRARQPQIIINNRAMTTEDTATPEQHVAASRPGRLWEACMTMNANAWGYNPHDPDYKSARQIILTLAACAAGQGNLLLNVGPDPAGRFPRRSVERLDEVGRWIDRHAEAIYTTDRNPLMWYLFGPTTVQGNNLYCFLRNYYGSRLTIGGLTSKVLGATLLTTGQALGFEQRGPQTFVTGLPDKAPGIVPVVKLELDGKPDHDISRVIGRVDVPPDLPG